MPSLARRLEPYISPWLVAQLKEREWSGDQPTFWPARGAVVCIDLCGFTRIADQASRGGARGVEELSRLINVCFGQLVEAVSLSGGHVVRFPGDAVIAIYPTGYEGEETTVLRAVACANMLARSEVADPAGGPPLRFKAAVVHGALTLGAVGGIFGRWEPLIAGPPLMELGHTLYDAAPAQCRLARSTAALVAGAVECADDGKPSALVSRIASPPDARDWPSPVEPPMELLQAFAPRALVTRVLAGDGAWIGEHRLVTVLFIHFVGLERDGAETYLQGHMALRCVQSVLYGFEGALDKLNLDDKGLTVLAAFGLPPLTHEDDALRAVLAAKAIQDRVAELGVAVRIGLATGPVFCGPIGSLARREYTMIGTTVNRAARLMASQAAEIVCDGETRDATRYERVFVSLGTLTLKGLSQPASAFTVRVDSAEWFTGPKTPWSSAWRGRCLGRDEELWALSAEVGRLEHGTPFLAHVAGNAGMGKTRLIDELLSSSGQAAPAVQVLRGYCESVHSGQSYRPWRTVLLGCLHLDGATLTARSLNAAVQRLTGSTERVPLLDALAGLDMPDTPTTRGLTGAVRQDNLHAYFYDLLAAAAAERPVLVVLEDVHWLDADSWGLLAYLHSRATQSPIGIVVTSRLVSRDAPAADPLLHHPTVLRVELRPLGSSEIATLVGARLGAHDVTTDVVEFIQTRARGNPLFAEEIARVMADRGELEVSHGVCRLNTSQVSDDAPVPETVSKLITERLDRLPVEHQWLLKAAAVVGQRFERSAVAHMPPVDALGARLDDVLAELVERDFLRRDATIPDAYAFRHASTRDAAFEQLLYAQRRQLHGALATFLERDPNGDPAVLAHHWREADIPEPAARHSGAAGLRALRGGRFEAAIHHLAYALDHDVEAIRADRPGHLAAIGEAQTATGTHMAARDHLERALTLVQAPVPRTSLGMVTRITWELIVQVGRRLRGNVQAAAAADRYSLAAQVYEQLGFVYYAACETIPGIHAALRMLNLAERAGPRPVLARAYAASALTASVLPWRGGVARYQRMADALAIQLGDPSTSAYVGWIRATCAVGEGRWEDARRAAAEASEHCDDSGNDRVRVGILESLGLAAFFERDASETTRLAEAQFTLARQHRNRLWEIWALNGFGEAALLRQDQTEALRSATSALRLLERERDRSEEVRALGIGAWALDALSRRNEALDWAARALELIQTTELTTFATYSGYAAAEALFQLHPTASSASTSRVRYAARSKRAMARFRKVFSVESSGGLRGSREMGPA
jgi:class 3 adenylate cyclase